MTIYILTTLFSINVRLHTPAELEAMKEPMKSANLRTVNLTNKNLVKDHLRHLVRMSEFQRMSKGSKKKKMNRVDYLKFEDNTAGYRETITSISENVENSIIGMEFFSENFAEDTEKFRQNYSMFEEILRNCGMLSRKLFVRKKLFIAKVVFIVHFE